MIKEQKIIQLLKDHGLRVTDVRKEVLLAFLAESAALSHQDIEGRLGEVDRITLYRTLKSFEGKGLIHKAIDGTSVPKYALCDHNCSEDDHHDHHVHFHCETCGHTFCLDEIKIPDFKAPAGIKIHSADVVLSGLCENCQ